MICVQSNMTSSYSHVAVCWNNIDFSGLQKRTVFNDNYWKRTAAPENCAEITGAQRVKMLCQYYRSWKIRRQQTDQNGQGSYSSSRGANYLVLGLRSSSLLSQMPD